MVRGRLRGACRGRFRARRTGALLAAILAVPLLAACGQRGPLYLPKPPAEPPPRVRTPSSGTVVLPPSRTPSDAPATGTQSSERPAAPRAD